MSIPCGQAARNRSYNFGSRRTTTDDNGRYVLHNVALGPNNVPISYTILAQKNGFFAAATATLAVCGAAATADLTMVARQTGRVSGRVVVGLRVETRAEVDRLYAVATAAGHPGLQPPHDAFWGARYAIVEDPDGLAVGLQVVHRLGGGGAGHTSVARITEPSAQVWVAGGGAGGAGGAT